MGRPSKLSDKQWEQIGRRIVAGEKPSALAKEFKVSHATVSERFSESGGKVKSVANQILAAEDSLKA
ncbi:MAG: Hin recombinase [Variovorax sp.]|nr:MAG: Hin recombinase [Variovorax sp.]